MNTPLASSASVAELVIGFMFGLARSIVTSTNSMRASKWEKKKFEGEELCGKTLGVIGIGNIGKEVAKRAQALGMSVIAFDPYIKLMAGVEIVSFDNLLARADYISLHVPKTKETARMIGAGELARMKTGVRLINCSRGGVVDEDALYDALVSGQVGGAALDVFAVEPCEGHKLFSLENVIGSPHIGAATKEAQARVGAEVADKLIDFYKNNGN
jgi:D-3-phosphoglycerate dehydrogenase